MSDLDGALKAAGFTRNSGSYRPIQRPESEAQSAWIAFDETRGVFVGTLELKEGYGMPIDEKMPDVSDDGFVGCALRE